MVLYDASAMVRSLLAHLLEPHLIQSVVLCCTLIEFPRTTPEPFPQRSVPTRERQAPCGGLTGDADSLPVESPSRFLKKIKILSSRLQHGLSIFVFCTR